MPTLNLGQRKKREYNTRIKIKYTSNWSRLRESWLMSHPLCEMCLAEGRSTLAEEVHHKKPISRGKTREEQMDLMLDDSNLMSLCVPCHHRLHRMMNEER